VKEKTKGGRAGVLASRRRNGQVGRRVLRLRSCFGVMKCWCAVGRGKVQWVKGVVWDSWDRLGGCRDG